MTPLTLKVVLTPDDVARLEALGDRPLDVVMTPRQVARLAMRERSRIRNERRAATYRGRA